MHLSEIRFQYLQHHEEFLRYVQDLVYEQYVQKVNKQNLYVNPKEKSSIDVMKQKLIQLTSSRLINSLLNVKPGITPRSRNQKIDANDPLKNIPSTQANATKRSANGVFSFIQRIAQSAFFFT